MLFALLLIPLFVLVYLRMQAQRRKLAARFNSFGVGAGKGSNAASNVGWRRHIPAICFLLALIILILAIARPETVVNLPRVEGTVILAFDVSGSMAADDLKPNRMEAAKAAAQSFVEQQPRSVLIGVVAFSDTGLTVQPPTNDQAAVLATINRIRPQRGTSLANGIFSALNTILLDKNKPSLYSNLTPEATVEPTPMPKGSYTSAAVVLITDGENTAPPDPLEAAKVAADRGVRIYTVGIGSPAGVDLKVEGFTVHTQLDEATLKQISMMTNGAYFNASSEAELLEIYNNLNPQLELKPERTEITSIFAGLGICMLLIGGLVSLLMFGRFP
jgi:Ca-activated chloride channel family protein